MENGNTCVYIIDTWGSKVWCGRTRM